MRLGHLAIAGSMSLVLGAATRVHAQEAEPYTRGERKRLLILVQVLGEVRQPGEYSIPDDTDLLGLISKAGGTTEFGDLSTVRVTHRPGAGFNPTASSGTGGGSGVRSEIVNVEAFLQGEAGSTLLVMQPGDVVVISRNSWFRWRSVAAVLRDISVVATAVFLGIRTFDNNPNN
jgi:hypothetical protein